METPHSKPSLRDTNNRRRALGIRVKLPVAEQATDKSRGFVLPYVYVPKQ